MFVVAFDFSTLLKSGIPPIRIIFIDWSIIAIKTSVINIFWLKKLFIFVYIGGGYPELFSKELSQNTALLKQIKQFHMENRPIFAECGGLMYLMNSIHEDKQVGVYPYNSILTDKVQALKYTIAEVKKDNIISKKGEKFNGHEFHYSKVLVDNSNIKHDLAFNILRGKGSYNNQDGFMEKNTLASYVHTHVAAMPNFGGNLAISAREVGG